MTPKQTETLNKAADILSKFSNLSRLEELFEDVEETQSTDPVWCNKVLIPYVEEALRGRWYKEFPLTYHPSGLPIEDPLSPPWFKFEESDNGVTISPLMRLVRHIDVADEYVGEHPTIFSSNPNWDAIESIDISTCSFCEEPEPLEHLLASDWAPQIKFLNIGTYNDVEDEHVAMIANAPSMSNLVALSFRNNEGLSVEAMRAIVESPHLSQVRHLDLTGCFISEGANACLEESDFLLQLKSLELGQSFTSGKDREQLWRSPKLAGLEHFSLLQDEIDEAHEEFGPPPHLRVSITAVEP